MTNANRASLELTHERLARRKDLKDLAACEELSASSPTGDAIVAEADEHAHLLAKLAERLRSLPSDRNKQMLFRRMNGERLRSIGDSYGISAERVRQIERKTISALRDGSARKGTGNGQSRN